MTDTPTGRELVEKTFTYMTTLSHECRKALTSSLEKQKGMPFDSVEPMIRREVESWFAERDRNITVKHENSTKGRSGEILMTYSGSNKGARFKFTVNAMFTLADQTDSAPSYLKSINVNVDKRDFTK